jgi:hypothetical protein
VGRPQGHDPGLVFALVALGVVSLLGIAMSYSNDPNSWSQEVMQKFS